MGVSETCIESVVAGAHMIIIWKGRDETVVTGWILRGWGGRRRTRVGAQPQLLFDIIEASLEKWTLCYPPLERSRESLHPGGGFLVVATSSYVLQQASCARVDTISHEIGDIVECKSLFEQK